MKDWNNCIEGKLRSWSQLYSWTGSPSSLWFPGHYFRRCCTSWLRSLETPRPAQTCSTFQRRFELVTAVPSCSYITFQSFCYNNPSYLLPNLSALVDSFVQAPKTTGFELWLYVPMVSYSSYVSWLCHALWLKWEVGPVRGKANNVSGKFLACELSTTKVWNFNFHIARSHGCTRYLLVKRLQLWHALTIYVYNCTYICIYIHSYIILYIYIYIYICILALWAGASLTFLLHLYQQSHANGQFIVGHPWFLHSYTKVWYNIHKAYYTPLHC